GLGVGEKISLPGDATTKAIQNLWAQGLFSDVEIGYSRIQGNKIFLTVQIKERPRLSKFKFEGIKKAEADDLRDEVNLYREKILTDNLLVTTRKKVETYFIDKGFLNVEVNLKNEIDTNYANH